jgi:hypothetical protein
MHVKQLKTDFKSFRDATKKVELARKRIEEWKAQNKEKCGVEELASDKDDEEELEDELLHLSTEVGLKLSFLAPEELGGPASTPVDDTAKRLEASGREEQTLEHRLATWGSLTTRPSSTDQFALNQQEDQVEQHNQTTAS